MKYKTTMITIAIATASMALFQNFTILKVAPGPSTPEIGVVYSEEIDFEGSSAVSRLTHQRFMRDLLNFKHTNESAFPYVTVRDHHTFVYFSQLETGVHGEGSVPIIALRKASESHWSWYTLFKYYNGELKLNEDLKKILIDLKVVKTDNPLELREHVFKLNPRNGALEHSVMTKLGYSFFSPLMSEIYKGKKNYYRTAYKKDGDAYLLSSEDPSARWSLPTHKSKTCTAVAKMAPYHFSEAAAARVRRNRWVAAIRETTGKVGAHQTHRLFEAHSFDNGCTWSNPVYIGEGTQPSYTRIIKSDTDERLVLCVGDRTSSGITKEIGIQCRISSNLLDESIRFVQWGRPVMIFTLPYGVDANGRKFGNGSDLGQPQTIRIGKDTLETYFYSTDPAKPHTSTDILYVRHRIRNLPLP